LSNRRRTGDFLGAASILHDDWLFGAGRHEDLDRVVVITVGALVQRALDEGCTHHSNRKRRVPRPVPA
jgi:hypothetical protein